MSQKLATLVRGLILAGIGAVLYFAVLQHHTTPGANDRDQPSTPLERAKVRGR